MVIERLLKVASLPLDFHGRIRVVRSIVIPGALHGIEASLLSHSSLFKLRSRLAAAVRCKRQPVAHAASVLSFLDGPEGCDLGFCLVWIRFRMLNWNLAHRSHEVRRDNQLLSLVNTGCLGHGLVHLLLESAATVCFVWDSHNPGRCRPGLLCFEPHGWS